MIEKKSPEEIRKENKIRGELNFIVLDSTEQKIGQMIDGEWRSVKNQEE